MYRFIYLGWQIRLMIRFFDRNLFIHSYIHLLINISVGGYRSDLFLWNYFLSGIRVSLNRIFSWILLNSTKSIIVSWNTWSLLYFWLRNYVIDWYNFYLWVWILKFWLLHINLIIKWLEMQKKLKLCFRGGIVWREIFVTQQMENTSPFQKWVNVSICKNVSWKGKKCLKLSRNLFQIFRMQV